MERVTNNDDRRVVSTLNDTRRHETHGTCDGCGATDTAIACWDCERCELCACPPGCINNDDDPSEPA